MAAASPKITVFDTPEQLGKAAAEMILAEHGKKGRLVLGVPWGTTPVPFLDAFARIVAEEKTDLSKFHMVTMDEYMVKTPSGYAYVDKKAPYSGHYHLEKDIFSKLPEKQAAQLRANTHFPNPAKPEEFDSFLTQTLGGVDTFIIGVGAHDGHVAMDGPGTKLETRTRIVPLPETLRQYSFEKMHDLFSNSMENVPKFGITTGLRTLLDSKKLLFVAFGSGKSKITQRLLSAKKFDINWPVTFIWEAMGKTEFYLDNEAAGK